MEPIDVTKYEPIIKAVMRQLKVPRTQQEDTLQDCYVRLLEENTEDEEQAALLCSRLISNAQRNERKRGQDLRLKPDSMSDPRTAQKVAKLVFPEAALPEEKLDEAVRSLPYEIYQVIYGLFFEGRTLEQVGADLKLTIKQVRIRRDRGIKALKKYFEV